MLAGTYTKSLAQIGILFEDGFSLWSLYADSVYELSSLFWMPDQGKLTYMMIIVMMSVMKVMLKMTSQSFKEHLL